MRYDGLGWCNHTPFVPPATCRWCSLHTVIGPTKNAGVVLACPKCDMTERWPKRGIFTRRRAR